MVPFQRLFANSATLERGVLLITPPLTAIGGIATHSSVLTASMPEVRVFDQWWPFRERAGSRAARWSGHLAALVRLAAVMTRHRPPSVHLQVSERGIRRDIVQARIARRAGAAVVAHLHSEFPDPASHDALAHLTSAVDAVIVLDEATQEKVVAVATTPGATRDVTVVANPVHPSFVDTPLPGATARAVDQELRLFCPALIGELKNQAGILRALDLAAAEGVRSRLVMAGRWDPNLSAPERAAIEGHPRAEHLGVVRGDSLIREYDRADALVLFSRTEGEPMSVLEGLGRALPVLASDVGNVRSLVPSVEPNQIVQAGDTDGLAAAIVRLSQHTPGEGLRVMQNRRSILQTRSPSGHVEAIREVHRRARARRADQP